MTLCIENIYCGNFDWSLFFNGITALGTLGVFVFAIIIVRNISFKKDLRRKQLDTVFELVTHLQGLKLYFSFQIDINNGKNISCSVGNIWFYFFDMTKEKLKTHNDLTKGNPIMLISEKFLYENPIFKYAHNPFLPKSIVLKLINLYPRGGKQFSFEPKNSQIYISDDREYAKHMYRKEISQYYLTVNKLFETAEQLNKSIKIWLKENGVNDLNIMDKPINLENYP